MKTNNTEKSEININEIKGVYLNYSNEDLLFVNWSNPEQHDRLRQIIKYELTDIEQTVLLLYSELGSYRRVGEILGVSATTIYYKVRDIRNKIKDNYYKNND